MPSPPFTQADIEIGDWIKYDIGNGKTNIAEVQAFYGGGGSGGYVSMVTADGYVHFHDVLEVRRGAPRPPPATVTPIGRKRR